MSRRRPRIETGTTSGEEVDEEEIEEDLEDEPTSLEDLTVESDPETFDRTFQVTSSDEPFATDDTPAIPRPWQGIPRVAVTYNLNFVWDDDAGEWQRDTGNRTGLPGAGGATAHPTTDQAAPAGSSVTVDLEATDPDPDGNFDLATDAYVVPTDGRYLVTGLVSFADVDDGQNYEAAIEQNGTNIVRADLSTSAPRGNAGAEAAPVSRVIEATEGDSLTLVARPGSLSDTTVIGRSERTFISVIGLAP